MKPDFDMMNETDVREIIVRPLLERLGYKHGTQANIRTEVSLKYERAFLGRKNPKKDPPLAGRADYICDATSYGRWAVEAKAPSHSLSKDDVEQAHTYCAHPEVAAIYFLLTNGREFQLYATSQLDDPLLSWTYDEIDRHILTLFNIVGYAAIRKLNEAIQPDVNKPLGAGLQSRIRILGGDVIYGEHRSDHPLFQVDPLNGMVASVTGESIERAADGRLVAVVSIRNAYPQFSELNRLAGLERFEFFCSDEYISSDVNRPTIFQNVIDGRVEPGMRTKLFPGLPEIAIPIGFQFTACTQAVGYIDGDRLKGLLSFENTYHLIRGRSGNLLLDAKLAAVPGLAKVEGTGEFNILTGRDRESR